MGVVGVDYLLYGWFWGKAIYTTSIYFLKQERNQYLLVV